MRCLVALLMVGCAGSPWQAEALREHPLVGTLWDVGADGPTTEAGLVDALASAQVVMLGEQHDHPDHHRLHARLIRRLRPKAVAFEMLDVPDAAGVAAATDADSLAQHVDWAHSGWPDFALYRPVFAATYAVGATIVVAHPSRETLRGAMMKGLASRPEVDAARLGLDRPLSEGAQADLEAEIRESHCGHAPESIVGPMASAQRLKDAWMADRLRGAPRPAVLVAGNGHVRKDRGVPSFVPGVAVAFLPVRPGATRPEDYDVTRFDFVWFTPRVDTEDPCVKFRRQLEKIRRPRPGATPPTPGSAHRPGPSRG